MSTGGQQGAAEKSAGSTAAGSMDVNRPLVERPIAVEFTTYRPGERRCRARLPPATGGPGRSVDGNPELLSDRRSIVGRPFCTIAHSQPLPPSLIRGDKNSRFDLRVLALAIDRPKSPGLLPSPEKTT